MLAHNAGGMFGERRLTEDGHELTMQVNYFAPFLLQHLLHDRLSTSGAHIVVTSSVAHRGGRIDLDDLDFTNGRHSGSSAYNASKLADLLFAREIARRTPQTGITAVAFHPGNVRSGVGREASGVMSLIYNTQSGGRCLSTRKRGRGAAGAPGLPRRPAQRQRPVLQQTQGQRPNLQARPRRRTRQDAMEADRNPARPARCSVIRAAAAGVAADPQRATVGESQGQRRRLRLLNERGGLRHVALSFLDPDSRSRRFR